MVSLGRSCRHLVKNIAIVPEILSITIEGAEVERKKLLAPSQLHPRYLRYCRKTSTDTFLELPHQLGTEVSVLVTSLVLRYG